MPRSGPVTKDTSLLALGLAQVRVGPSAIHIASKTAVLSPANSIGALGQVKLGGATEYFRFASGFPQLEDAAIPLSEKSQLEVTYSELAPLNVALSRGLDPFAAVPAAAGDYMVISSTAGTRDTTKSIAPDASGTISDTWIVTFTSAANYTVTGLKTGRLGSAGAVGTDYAPQNAAASNAPYFTIPAGFFNGTWAANDTFTFRTTKKHDSGNAFGAHSGEIGLGAMKLPAYVRMEAIYTYPNMANRMVIIYPRCQVTSNFEVEFKKQENAEPPMTFEAKRADSEVVGGDAAWDNCSLGVVYFE